MKNKILYGYTDNSLDATLQNGDEFNGLRLMVCSQSCRKRCQINDERCRGHYPDGTYFKDRVLAKELEKSPSKLTQHDREVKSAKIEHKAFLKCRRIKVKIEETRSNL